MRTTIYISLMFFCVIMSMPSLTQKETSQASRNFKVKKLDQINSQELLAFLNSLNGTRENVGVLKKWITIKCKSNKRKKSFEQKETIVASVKRKEGEYDQIIAKASNDHEVDPNLVKAVINVESEFKSRAVSPKGAEGLMGLMPKTAKSLGVVNSLDPEDNINGGTKYLAENLKRFNGDTRLALAAYNAGPTLVASIGRIPNNPETKKYVQTVMARYRVYKNQG